MGRGGEGTRNPITTNVVCILSVLCAPKTVSDAFCIVVWQVRDEFREDYDEGRGGLGKKHQERMDRGFDARRRY